MYVAGCLDWIVGVWWAGGHFCGVTEDGLTFSGYLYSILFLCIHLVVRVFGAGNWERQTTVLKA